MHPEVSFSLEDSEAKLAGSSKSSILIIPRVRIEPLCCVIIPLMCTFSQTSLSTRSGIYTDMLCVRSVLGAA